MLQVRCSEQPVSAKMVEASSKETPCLKTFAAALFSSHSNWYWRSSKTALIVCYRKQPAELWLLMDVRRLVVL